MADPSDASSADPEVDDPAADEAAPPRHPSRVRQGLAVALGILCCISLLVSVVGVWARKTVFDTDYWVAQVTPLATDEAVLVPLENYLTTQIMEAADLENRLKQRLPAQLDVVAVPLAAGARTYVSELVDKALHSERFQKLWVEINRVAHTALVRFIDGSGEVVQTSTPGTITLNLLPVINWLLQEVEQGASSLFNRDIALPEVTSGELPSNVRDRLSQVLGRPLPEDFGQIPIYQSDRLGVIQEGLLLFRKLVTFLIVFTIVLGVGSVLLAHRRARATAMLALGVLLSLSLGRAAVGEVKRQLLDIIVNPGARGAASSAFGQLIASFYSLTGWLLGIGVVLLVAGLLASDLSPMRRVREGAKTQLTPAHLTELAGPRRPLLAGLGIAFAFAILLIADQPSLAFLVFVLLALGAYELGLVAIERRWHVEHPLPSAA